MEHAILREGASTLNPSRTFAAGLERVQDEDSPLKASELDGGGVSPKPLVVDSTACQRPPPCGLADHAPV